MTTPPASAPHRERQWYGLALRHLRMASLLLTSYPDGAFFHCYHAYECAVSALIAARGYHVPPEGRTYYVNASGKQVKYYPSPTRQITEPSSHKAKFLLFNDLADRTKQYFSIHSTLSRFITVVARNDALYYNEPLNLLPQDRLTTSDALSAYREVRKFALEIWKEIR
jgi:hypothetical protein